MKGWFLKDCIFLRGDIFLKKLPEHTVLSQILMLFSISFFSFSLNGPHWADSVIELPRRDVCLSVYLSVCAIRCSFFFEASHWPWGHMISSRPLIGPPSLPPPRPAPAKV